MTREEAIQYLQPIADSAHMKRYSEALGVAITALREQEAATKCSQSEPVTGSHQLEPVTNRNGLTGWISVEDRLPPDEKTVLAYYGYDIDGSGGSGRMFVGTLCYFCFDPDPHWQHAGNGLFVTHWMPLPAAPEEKENPHETKTNDQTADGRRDPAE